MCASFSQSAHSGAGLDGQNGPIEVTLRFERGGGADICQKYRKENN